MTGIGTVAVGELEPFADDPGARAEMVRAARARDTGERRAGGSVEVRGDRHAATRASFILRRALTLVPPQTPSMFVNGFEIAYSRHGSATGHRAQAASASGAHSPRPGKNSAGSMPLHAARSRQTCVSRSETMSAISSNSQFEDVVLPAAEVVTTPPDASPQPTAGTTARNP